MTPTLPTPSLPTSILTDVLSAGLSPLTPVWPQVLPGVHNPSPLPAFGSAAPQLSLGGLTAPLGAVASLTAPLAAQGLPLAMPSLPTADLAAVQHLLPLASLPALPSALPHLPQALV